jgi:molybdopterin converting factor small subunit
MKILIEYMGFFKIKDVPSKSEIEVDDGTTIEELLDKLDVPQEHRKYLTPLVRRKREKLDYRLQDGDDLFLHYPVGGG